MWSVWTDMGSLGAKIFREWKGKEEGMAWRGFSEEPNILRAGEACRGMSK